MIALEKINCTVSHYSERGCKQLKNEKENGARLLLFEKNSYDIKKYFQSPGQVIPITEIRARNIPSTLLTVPKRRVMLLECICKCIHAYTHIFLACVWGGIYTYIFIYIYPKFTNTQVELRLPKE